MSASGRYNGTLTAEQFLFHEMRIVSGQYLENKSIEEIIEFIRRDNLFQYPTERMVIRIARSCYKRIIALTTKPGLPGGKRPRRRGKADQPLCNDAIQPPCPRIYGGCYRRKYRRHDFSYTKGI